MYDFSNLSPAVAYWLNYKKLTGLDGLFSEASMVVPIAEFLKTKGVPKLRSEITHPHFKSRRGRPRQVNFVGYSKHGNWAFAIEAKYLPSTMQSIVNDLARLLLLDQDNCERFIVIGLPMVEGDTDQAFSIKMKVLGKHVNVLKKFFWRTKKDQNRIIHIDKLEPQIRELFRNFMKDYSVNNMPNAFQTKCIKFRRTGEFATGMWRISARKGTGSISIANL